MCHAEKNDRKAVFPRTQLQGKSVRSARAHGISCEHLRVPDIADKRDIGAQQRSPALVCVAFRGASDIFLDDREIPYMLYHHDSVPVHDTFPDNVFHGGRVQERDALLFRICGDIYAVHARREARRRSFGGGNSDLCDLLHHRL